MQFFKQLFKSQSKQNKPKDSSNKSSIFSWLCTSKEENKHQTQQKKLMKVERKLVSTIKNASTTKAQSQSSNSKISHRISFQIDNDYFHQQFISSFVSILQRKFENLYDLLGESQLCGLISNDEHPFQQRDNVLWLKIGRNQQLNSLFHIKPYLLDQIFMIGDEFGYEYSIQEIVKSKQQITIKVNKRREIQNLINCYQKQLMKLYGFRPLGECLNKFHIYILHVNSSEIWLKFNERIDPNSMLDQILQTLGFDSSNSEYLELKHDIPKGISLQNYIQIIKHKQKLSNLYEGQSVQEFIKSKLIEKLESPRRNNLPAFKKKISVNESSNNQYYEFFMSINSKQYPINQLEMSPQDNSSPDLQNHDLQKYIDPYQINDDSEEIFNFNVYKDQRQQQAKRVAIVKERKVRSRSADIMLNELENSDQDVDTDYFDEKQ